MITQLRLYTIKAGKMDAWLEGWTTSVHPLRLKHGFRVPGAWVIPETNQFLWLLAYDGSTEEFAAKNEAYYDSEDRKTLTPDPAVHIEKQETWFVRPIVRP